MIRPLIWKEDHILLIDQRVLPQKEVWLELRTWEDVYEAIQNMSVRGAPAIGVTAAYGMVLAANQAQTDSELKEIGKRLSASRPTAVNLAWAIERILSLSNRNAFTILAEAIEIEKEDIAMNHEIGRHGASLVPNKARILTICNTGSLATAGHGTALGIIRTAFAEGKVDKVWSCETRPRQQGLRLTAWELLKDGIPFASIADSVAGSLMQAKEIDFVVAGADRIAQNGDSANKIGTYSLAVLAHHHNIPFVIAAPSSTFDTRIPDGSYIPIEERGSDELAEIERVRVAPPDCPVYNPGFDVTPGELITAIVTEKGVHQPPYHFS